MARITGTAGLNYQGPWILFIGYLGPRDLEMKHETIFPALNEAGFMQFEYDHDDVHWIPDRITMIKAVVLVEALIEEHGLDMTIEFEQTPDSKGPVFVKTATSAWIQQLAEKAVDDMGDIFYDVDMYEGRMADDGCDTCVQLGREFDIRLESEDSDGKVYACVDCDSLYTEKEISVYNDENGLQGRRHTKSEDQQFSAVTSVAQVIADALQQFGVVINDPTEEATAQ